jgi:hypothetical protein
MSVKLTDTQLVMMSAAAQRKDRCLSAPATIKGAALVKVSAKLAKLGLAREIVAKPGAPIWRRDDAGQGYALKLTAVGLKAIAVDLGSPDAIEPGEAPQLQAKNAAGPDEGCLSARVAVPRQQAGAGDRTSAARRRRDRRRFDSGDGMAAAHDAGGAHLAAQTGYAVIRERIGAKDSVYRISDAPSYKGDCTVRQRDAMDGRGPKRKATQTA